jgi:hypothetical protein
MKCLVCGYSTEYFNEVSVSGESCFLGILGNDITIPE